MALSRTAWREMRLKALAKSSLTRTFVSLSPGSGGVDTNFNPSSHSHAKLSRPERAPGIILNHVRQALGSQAPQHLANGYRPDPSSRLRHRHQACASKQLRLLGKLVLAQVHSQVWSNPRSRWSTCLSHRLRGGAGFVSQKGLARCRPGSFGGPGQQSSHTSSASGRDPRSAAGAGCAGRKARRAAAVSALSGQRPACTNALQAFRSKPSRARPMASSRRCSLLSCLEVPGRGP